jgi:anti-sigma factor RsiW
MHVEDWELEAYADGAADTRLDRLIRESPEMAQRVARIKAENAALRHALYRTDCPSVDELRDFQSGFLSAARAVEVQRHVAECRTCAADVAAYAQLDVEAQSVLNDVLTRAKQGFDILVGKLLPMSTPLPVLRGDEGESDAHTAVYGVPERDWQLALTWAIDELGYKLSGQLIAKDVPDAVTATLIGLDMAVTDMPTYEAGLDDVGWFVFHDLAPGHYELWLELSQTHIQIADIQIGPPG